MKYCHLLLTAHHPHCRIESSLGQHHLLLPDDLPVPGEVNLNFVPDLHLRPPPVLLVPAVRLVLLSLLLSLQHIFIVEVTEDAAVVLMIVLLPDIHSTNWPAVRVVLRLAR